MTYSSSVPIAPIDSLKIPAQGTNGDGTIPIISDAFVVTYYQYILPNVN
jgi:hypothetical protein